MPWASEYLVEKEGAARSDYFDGVRHILVWGSEEEIGRSLAELGGTEYGVRYALYDDAERNALARARLLYFERNWPEMRARIQGVAEHCSRTGEAGPDTHDLSALIYDVAPDSVPYSGCSAVFLPRACTAEDHPLVARNFDAWQKFPREIFRKNPKETYPRKLYQRPFVVEISPASGNRVLAIGGHDLMFPFQDALNDKGLFITSLADRNPAVIEHMAMAGGRNTGLTSRQLLLFLASKCDTVAAVKKEVFAQQIRMDTTLHWLIADAGNAATVLELDSHGCATFLDRKSDADPYPVTNHQLTRSRTSETKDGPAYNTYVRLQALQQRARDMIGASQGRLSRKQAESLMDVVACCYVDPKAAGVDPMHDTLTAWMLTADLQKKDLEIGFYLRSRSPHEIPNRKTIDWKRWRIGFGFRRQEIAPPAASGAAAAPAGEPPGP